MTNDLLKQKQDLEFVVKAREARIATHKMEIAAERSLIKADQNTIDVLTRLIEKMTAVGNEPDPRAFEIWSSSPGITTAENLIKANGDHHPVKGVNQTIQP